MELQRTIDRAGEPGTAVVAMSYDPVEVLADFAATHGIRYPMLSDVGSHTIRALGLERDPGSSLRPVEPGDPPDRDRGLPHPATFLLDREGFVQQRHVEAGHRVRPSGSVLLADELAGVDADVDEQRSVDGVAVGLRMLQASYHPKQYQRLAIVVDAPADRHVYVGPVPDGFLPLTVGLSGPDDLVVEDVRMPAGRPHQVEGMDERLPVIEGRSEVEVTFRIDTFQGDVTLRVDVGLQSCSSTECFAPAELRFDLPLTGHGTVDAP